MEINIAMTTYEVELLTETGTLYNLTDALLDLQWEEETNNLAVRGNIIVANMAIGSTWLMAIAKIGCRVLIYANWGFGRELIHEGTIWEWAYSSATQKEITLTTYDNAKYLLQSNDYFYFSAGLETTAILNTVCGQWGVPLSYKWGQTMTHEKKVFNNETIADIIVSLLEEVKEHVGEEYVCHWKDGALTVENRGTNSDIFKFEEHNTISTQNKISINELVTKVKIIGVADDDGRSAVEAEVDGDQSFGLMQRILIRDCDKTLDSAISEAQAYIDKYNTPEEQIAVEAPDLPFLRKGDKVEICAGNLIGEFYIIGITHNGTNKKMTLTLVSPQEV